MFFVFKNVKIINDTQFVLLQSCAFGITKILKISKQVLTLCVTSKFICY